MAEQDADNKELEKPPPDKSLIIFGRDVSKIPCFRNSFLYGIYGGLGLGLGHFMFKSRPLAACNFAVYSFCGVTLVYWIQCRYKYSQMKFQMLQMQELLRRQTVFEGTHVEKELDDSIKNDPKVS
ncbi:cytochrome c oxidase assembly protein COX20, mitochondrial [Zophobas morio]|uniref:cytochrome c oxidase assembly protein COX20, mitochondrial n=1 Tax=Zophobas morio TaxID=2755281 RepID=UPI003082F446